MKLITLGSGNAIHDDRRVATSSLVVTRIGNFLVDCGTGSGYRLAQAGYAPTDLKAILITHLHQDHCLELPAILHSRILLGNFEMPDIYGPIGIAKHCSILFEELYSYIPTSAKQRGGKEFDLRIHELESGAFIDEDKLKVSCAPVKHLVPTLAYRLDTPEGSIGFSGDTEPYEPLADFCQHTDLFVHECLRPDSFGSCEGHTIPSQLGPIAQRSGTKHLVLNHMGPSVKGHEQEMIDSIAKEFHGRITVAEDLMEFEVQKTPQSR